MITTQNKSNLKQLADRLALLPKDYTHFGMSEVHASVYQGEFHRTLTQLEIVRRLSVSECGAIACALGHCSDAGLPVEPLGESGLPDWETTSRINFGFSVDSVGMLFEAWEWMFGAGWANTDNSPHGAAKRIYWYLEHGTPTDWEEQINGNTNMLCYEIPFPYS